MWTSYSNRKWSSLIWWGWGACGCGSVGAPAGTAQKVWRITGVLWWGWLGVCFAWFKRRGWPHIEAQCEAPWLAGPAAVELGTLDAATAVCAGCAAERSWAWKSWMRGGCWKSLERERTPCLWKAFLVSCCFLPWAPERSALCCLISIVLLSVILKWGNIMGPIKCWM